MAQKVEDKPIEIFANIESFVEISLNGSKQRYEGVNSIDAFREPAINPHEPLPSTNLKMQLTLNLLVGDLEKSMYFLR